MVVVVVVVVVIVGGGGGAGQAEAVLSIPNTNKSALMLLFL